MGELPLRGRSRTRGQEMRTGYDPRGRYIEMVGVLLADGVWLIYHAMTPPSKKTLKEIESARRRGY